MLGQKTYGEASMISWHEFETAAPPIAQLGRQRLEGTRVALLGTLRKDGSPRISPVEPYLSQGDLLFGAMSWSLKTRDLLHDPRCALHSAITGPNTGEAEFKIYGTRNAFRAFVAHLRAEGVTAIEKAVGRRAR